MPHALSLTVWYTDLFMVARTTPSTANTRDLELPLIIMMDTNWVQQGAISAVARKWKLRQRVHRVEINFR